MAGSNRSGRKGKTKRVEQSNSVFTVKCPSHMSKDAKVYWKTVVPMLDSRGVLTDLDAFAVERLCELYSQWKQLSKAITKDGMFYERISDRGAKNIAEHPAVKMKKEVEAEITRLSSKFGLTPKDRETIKAHKGKVTRSIRDEY